jgi:hypothetical protein
LDLVSIASRIGFVDTPASTGSSATVASDAGRLVGGAGGLAGGASGLAAGTSDIVASGAIGVFGIVDSPGEVGVSADADISFYIILRYFFR